MVGVRTGGEVGLLTALHCTLSAIRGRPLLLPASAMSTQRDTLEILLKYFLKHNDFNERFFSSKYSLMVLKHCYSKMF